MTAFSFIMRIRFRYLLKRLKSLGRVVSTTPPLLVPLFVNFTYYTAITTQLLGPFTKHEKVIMMNFILQALIKGGPEFLKLQVKKMILMRFF